MSLLYSLHNPELTKTPGMVYEIWEDGEITLTKSGELYGMRGTHTIVPGKRGVNVPLPVKGSGGHSSMAIADTDIAIARKLIVGEDDPYATCLPGKKYDTQQELYDEITRRNTTATNSATPSSSFSD